MEMGHTALTASPSLRVSLKRGLARQVIGAAERDAADLPTLFRMAAELRPNAKSADRVAARIKTRPGVARVAMNADHKGITIVARAVREVEARVQGETVFHETGLIYLRAIVRFCVSGIGFQLSAASFCRHAIERLVERSDASIETAVLPHIDTEALAIFRGWDRATLIAEAGDEFYPAEAPGVWAGGHDRMAIDPDWGLSNTSGGLPLFSVRTFLSETEMRPTVWLRWKNDPHCRMV